MVSIPQIELDWGWAAERTLQESLRAGRVSDYQAGATRSGPHRGDIAFTINGRPAASIYSRGQIKLFIAMLMVAQSEVLRLLTGEIPLFMVDDFAAELDGEARTRLVLDLMAQHNQVFLTSTELDKRLPGLEEATVFHVEHGEFKKMVK